MRILAKVAGAGPFALMGLAALLTGCAAAAALPLGSMLEFSERLGLGNPQQHRRAFAGKEFRGGQDQRHGIQFGLLAAGHRDHCPARFTKSNEPALCQGRHANGPPPDAGKRHHGTEQHIFHPFLPPANLGPG